MHDFKHCPLCAAQMAEIMVPEEGRHRLVCRSCAYIHYFNPRIVCGALPVEDGQLWLLRRGIEPRYGYWTYPAGFQELEETSEDAAVRETREEIGAEVEVIRLQGVYSRADATVVNIVYVARFLPDSPRPRTTPEAIEVRLFGRAELPWDELAFESTSRVLRDWSNHLLLPDQNTHPGGG